MTIEVMLEQNYIGKENQSISYKSQRLNKIKQNHLHKKYKVFAMVYAIKKYKHYLFGNRF